MHPSLTEAPPNTVAPVLYDHRIFPDSVHGICSSSICGSRGCHSLWILDQKRWQQLTLGFGLCQHTLLPIHHHLWSHLMVWMWSSCCWYWQCWCRPSFCLWLPPRCPLVRPPGPASCIKTSWLAKVPTKLQTFWNWLCWTFQNILNHEFDLHIKVFV